MLSHAIDSVSMSVAPPRDERVRAIERLTEYLALASKVHQLSAEALRFAERGDSTLAAITLHALMDPVEKLVEDRPRLLNALRSAHLGR